MFKGMSHGLRALLFSLCCSSFDDNDLNTLLVQLWIGCLEIAWRQRKHACNKQRGPGYFRRQLEVPLPQHLDATHSTCPESSSHVGTYSSSLHRCGLLIVAPARLLSQTSKEAFPSHRRRAHNCAQHAIQACVAQAASAVHAACPASFMPPHLGTSPCTPRPTIPRTSSNTS